MKKNGKRVPGFDEIIFENRNKEYGAYDLRKRYVPFASLSMAGGILIFTIFVFLLSLASKNDVIAERSPVIIVAKPDSSLSELHKVRPPDPETPKPELKPYRYVAPVVVENIDSTDKTLIPVSGLDSVINRPVDEITGPVDEPEETAATGSEPEPVIFAEEPPLFPGGNEALLRFIYDNVKYPEEALENKIEGRVVVKFVVNTDGTVSRAEVLKGVHPSLDTEALRVVLLMPRWKPGKQNGNPVRVWFNVQVKFELHNW